MFHSVHCLHLIQIAANSATTGTQRGLSDPISSRGDAMVVRRRTNTHRGLQGPAVAKRRRWRAPKRIGRLDGHLSRTEHANCDS